MRNIAVILAGGTGSRMYNEAVRSAGSRSAFKAVRSAGSRSALLPKQFMLLAGRAVIEYSLETFCNHAAIDEVAVVIHPEWRRRMEEIAAIGKWEKLTKIIDGGSERYMSSLNAIMAYIDEPDDTNLLLHDAARPMISVEIVDRVVSALERHEAVGVAVPSTDTVWEVHPDMSDQWPVTSGQWPVDSGQWPVDSGQWSVTSGQFEIPRFVARIPERRLMWRAQTPQAFRLPLIRDAYQRALQDPQFRASDDCGVVRKYMPGTKITVVEGEERNRKITYAEDLVGIEKRIE